MMAMACELYQSMYLIISQIFQCYLSDDKSVKIGNQNDVEL